MLNKVVLYLRSMSANSSAQGLTEKAKTILRSVLKAMRLDLTRNLAYDRMTDEIIRQNVKPGDVCIDVGCHRGEIMDLFLEQSKGPHWGFEPIPGFAEFLRAKYSRHPNVRILESALAETEGHATFHHVRNAPAYSGLKQRSYAVDKPDIEEIDVTVHALDRFLPDLSRVDFLKIDVEGAELGVLRGGKVLLQTHRPIILFECGLGASDYYGTAPEDIHSFLTQDCGYKLMTLRTFLNVPKEHNGLNEAEFKHLFKSNSEYYFMAVPKG